MSVQVNLGVNKADSTVDAEDKKPDVAKIETPLASAAVTLSVGKPKSEAAVTESTEDKKTSEVVSTPPTATTPPQTEKPPTTTTTTTPDKPDDTKSVEANKEASKVELVALKATNTQGDEKDAAKPTETESKAVEIKDQKQPEKKETVEAKKEDGDKKEEDKVKEPLALKTLASATPVIAVNVNSDEATKENVKSTTLADTVAEAVVDAIANKPVDDSLKPVFSIRPRHPVLSMALLNQDQLITGSIYSEIHLWSLSDNGRFVRVINETEWCGCVFSLQVHSDNQHILAGTEVGKVNVFRIADGGLVIGVPAHASPINALLLTKNNANEEILVTGSYDATIKLWQLIKLDHWKCLRVLKGHQSNVLASLAVSESQRRLVSGSGDGHLFVWDLETGERVKDIDTKSGSVDSLLVDEKKGYVITGHGNGEIKAWNIEKGECLKTLSSSSDGGGHKGDVGALVFDASGKVISGGQDGKVKAWDLNKEDGKCVNTIEKHRGEVWSLKLDAKGRIVSSAHDGTIRVWALP